MIEEKTLKTWGWVAEVEVSIHSVVVDSNSHFSLMEAFLGVDLMEAFLVVVFNSIFEIFRSSGYIRLLLLYRRL